MDLTKYMKMRIKDVMELKEGDIIYHVLYGECRVEGNYCNGMNYDENGEETDCKLKSCVDCSAWEGLILEIISEEGKKLFDSDGSFLQTLGVREIISKFDYDKGNLENQNLDELNIHFNENMQDSTSGCRFFFHTTFNKLVDDFKMPKKEAKELLENLYENVVLDSVSDMGEFYEMDRPKVGIGVCILRDNKILLGKRLNSHGNGEWSFPGGHLEFMESWEDCATRETLEETGLLIKNLRFGTVTNDFFPTENKHYITIIMIADYIEGEAQLMEPLKCEKWEWYYYDQLPIPLFIPIRNLMKQKFTPYEI